MDELDAEIIQLLQSDARLSNRELARRIGVAPSTCLERVRALTRRGVIRGYHADVDLKALNRGVQALVAVQVRPLRRSVIEAFKDSVGKLPEVMTVFVLAGGDDFLLHVAVQDLDHLHAFLLDRLSKRGEIVGFRTSVIYQRVHNTVLTHLPDAAPARDTPASRPPARPPPPSPASAPVLPRVRPPRPPYVRDHTTPHSRAYLPAAKYSF
jgi:DNA-binding Lrp family transcriptional regulator